MVDKIPDMNIAKYEQYVHKSLNAGTEGLGKGAYLQKVLSNMSHNLLAFLKRAHTYLTQTTSKTSERKLMLNEKIVKNLNSKFERLEKQLEKNFEGAEFGYRLEFMNKAVTDARGILNSMDRAGIPEDEVELLNQKLNVLEDVLHSKAFEGAENLKGQRKLEKEKEDLREAALGRVSKDDFQVSPLKKGAMPEKLPKTKRKLHEAEDVGTAKPKTTQQDLQDYKLQREKGMQITVHPESKLKGWVKIPATLEDENSLKDRGVQEETSTKLKREKEEFREAAAKKYDSGKYAKDDSDIRPSKIGTSGRFYEAEDVIGVKGPSKKETTQAIKDKISLLDTLLVRLIEKYEELDVKLPNLSFELTEKNYLDKKNEILGKIKSTLNQDSMLDRPDLFEIINNFEIKNINKSIENLTQELMTSYIPKQKA